MLIDGTWFDRDHCLIVYRDNTSKSTVFYRFAADENEYEIIKDLQAFKRLGLNIVSFTTDGADDIIRADMRIRIRQGNAALFISNARAWCG